jgi:EcsC protein family
VADAAEYIARHGVTQNAAPALVQFLAKVTERFGVQVTQKAAAQAIPAIGAAGGAIINTLFIDHFQNMARGHFIVRKLERKYGEEKTQLLYRSLIPLTVNRR